MCSICALMSSHWLPNYSKQVSRKAQRSSGLSKKRLAEWPASTLNNIILQFLRDARWPFFFFFFPSAFCIQIFACMLKKCRASHTLSMTAILPACQRVGVSACRMAGLYTYMTVKEKMV